MLRKHSPSLKSQDIGFVHSRGYLSSYGIVESSVGREWRFYTLNADARISRIMDSKKTRIERSEGSCSQDLLCGKGTTKLGDALVYA
jgi:hypothetical protein